MPRVIFSLTEHQAEALVAVADGGTIDSGRVETSLNHKGLLARSSGYHGRRKLSRRGRSAAALARSLIEDD